MKKNAAHLLVASALAVVPGLAACRPKPESPPPPAPPPNEVLLTKEQVKEMKIGVQTVAEQDVDDTILTSGKVGYDDQRVSHAYSPVSGKVARIDVKLGQRVKKGDLLAIIESPDIGTATSDVGKAKADLIAAEHDYMRQKDLYANHAASLKDLEAAEDTYRRAKAELERAEQKAALFRSGDVVGQTYTLHADIDGEIFMKAISPGMEIQGQYGGGTPLELFTIGEVDKVWVIADVYEMDLPRVSVGSKVVVNVPSWPNRNFSGVVDWVSSSLSADTHAAKVRCTFENGDRALKPEMFATVQISVDVKRALAIPRSAVLRLGEQTIVFLDRGPGPEQKERFERVPVSIDEGEGSKWLTVSRGLESGQRVVTDGAILLSAML